MSRSSPTPFLSNHFFDQPADKLAISLLGKIMRRKVAHPLLGECWLAARIIETEAYFQSEKGSHSSLGFTEKRKAMFMQPGTIYMYYARGADSLNFSARGEGDGVLIKSAYPYFDAVSPQTGLQIMQEFNPGAQGIRAQSKLCNGQTLLCKSLNLKVERWNQQQLNIDEFYLQDINAEMSSVIQCPRVGIPIGRDEHLQLRFIDYQYANCCTSNPLTRRHWQPGQDYRLLNISGKNE